MPVRRSSLALALGLALLPGGATAHPHIFIDAGVEFLFDRDGRLAALRIAWAYDEFFSLLVIEDLGLDPDYDGVLTEAERAALAGFDMAWVDGFAGDLEADQNGRPLALSGPLEWTADYRDGRIITTHVRAIADRPSLADGAVRVRVFDPTYYTAYTVAGTPRVTGRDGCTVQVIAPDYSAAAARLEAALAEMRGLGEDAVELDFPAVGAAFAEEVVLTCAPAS